MWPQISQGAAMRRDDICLYVSPANRSRLEAIVADRNSSSKAVWRARIVLATADGLGTNAIMKRTGKSKPCLWRWQDRYVEEGVEGLLRDKSRPPGKKPLSAAIKRKVLTKTASQTPPAATHWSVRTMAAEMGISHTSVQRIWAEAGLKPHLVRTFKISNDPQFEEKVSDVVGLYMNPPDKALVLCVDEKSQIQALDRTQPGLPLKKGRAATMTHDYKRHDHALCRARREERPRHRRLPAAPSGEGVHPLPQADRPHRRQALRSPPRRRQLRDAQDSCRESLACQAPPLPSALHADQRILAQPRRALLRRDHEEAHPARHLHQRRPPASRHPGLPERAQRQPQTFVWTKTADVILEKERRAIDALEAVKGGYQALESEH